MAKLSREQIEIIIVENQKYFISLPENEREYFLGRLSYFTLEGRQLLHDRIHDPELFKIKRAKYQFDLMYRRGIFGIIGPVNEIH